MLCPSCNNEVAEAFAYCPHCGAFLSAPDGFEGEPNVYLDRVEVSGTPSTMDFVEENREYDPPSLMDDLPEEGSDEAEITADLAPWLDQIEAGSIDIVETSGGDVSGPGGVMGDWQEEAEAPAPSFDQDQPRGPGIHGSRHDADADHGDTGFFDFHGSIQNQGASIYSSGNTDVELLSSNESLGKVGPKKQAAVRRDNFQVPTDTRELALFGAVALALIGIIWFGVSSLLSPAKPADVAPEQTEQVEGEDEGEAAAEDAAPTVEAKAGLGEYSWSELGIIAKEIEACGSREEALEVAARYNLVDGDRRMLGNTKHVELADNLAVPFAIVDVYHDDKADGSGKAGLTFMSWELVSVRGVNVESTNDGGWEGSDLRSYLADYAHLVPSELDEVVVDVTKMTNNTGYSTSPDCVTATTDRYWAPSFAEIAGAATWGWESDPANTDNFNAILNSEGSQYARFSENGVAADGYNDSLVYRISDGPVPWWLRSPSPSNSSRFRLVTSEGNPSMPGEVTEEHGIVLGFAL